MRKGKEQDNTLPPTPHKQNANLNYLKMERRDASLPPSFSTTAMEPTLPGMSLALGRLFSADQTLHEIDNRVSRVRDLQHFEDQDAWIKRLYPLDEALPHTAKRFAVN